MVARPQVGQAVQESVPSIERISVQEASVGGAKATKSGRMLVRLITAGVSLNGNAYPATVLEAAARSKAWPKGSKAYIDHATPEEEEAHPSGSVRNLAAVLTEDARWDPATKSLVAEVRLFEPWRGPLTEMAEEDAVGMSIRAWVSGEHGVFEGRDAFVVDRIEGGRSVDFVTVPAAGGGIISVLEAVGNPVQVDEAANLGAWLESRLHLTLTTYADDMYGDGQLTREERITLSAAIGDGLQAWTARVEADAPQLFQRPRWGDAEPAQPSPADESAPSDPTEGQTALAVPNVTDGAPPPAPATPKRQEEPVSGSQTGARPPEQAGAATVPDSEHTTTGQPAIVTALPDANAFTSALEAAMKPVLDQLAAVTAREHARDTEARALRNRQTASEAVNTALQADEHGDVRQSISRRVATRVTMAVPTTAEGLVDDTKLGELITQVIADEATHVRTERARALEEAGVGMPFGMGGTPAVQESTDDSDGLDAELETFFSRSLGLSESAAKVAARGRG